VGTMASLSPSTTAAAQQDMPSPKFIIMWHSFHHEREVHQMEEVRRHSGRRGTMVRPTFCGPAQHILAYLVGLWCWYSSS
jgi:hypothetical protein